MDRPALLFVCLGNICRSPMAEGAFRAAADDIGLDCEIDSCGTAAYHIGKSPDPRAIETAAKAGVDISALRARQLCEDDFSRFTHILAMDHQNLADIKAASPASASVGISLLLDHVEGREGAAVADPYYGGEEHFAYTWEDVNLAAKALAAKLAS